MDVGEFEKAIDEFVSGRMQMIQWNMIQGHIGVQNGVARFPTQCCLTEYPNHMIAEFFGSAEKFRKLEWHRKKQTSSHANEYFSQFPANEAVGVKFPSGARATTFSGLTVEATLDVKDQFMRLGFGRVTKLPGGLYSACPGPRMVFDLANTNFSLLLVDMLLLNAEPPVFRGKWVNLCVVASSDLTISELKKDLSVCDRPTSINGGPVASAIERSLIRNTGSVNTSVLVQFVSMFLTGAIRETSIGKFLLQHPEILSAAFGGTDFKHERTLHWQSSEAPAIRPDVFIQRKDGYWDICDLKTALLLEESLITGGPSKTKFKELVTSGLAQLSTYERYFEDERNAAHAEAEHGIRINNPQLILLIGNRDNLPADELQVACRLYSERFHVVDYDSVAAVFEQQLSLSASGGGFRKSGIDA